VTTALPVRTPQATGHAPAAQPRRPAYAHVGRYACEVDPDSEHRILREPNRRWCAQRAEFLVQVARLIQIRKAAGL
jgi:hypothetical protein